MCKRMYVPVQRSHEVISCHIKVKGRELHGCHGIATPTMMGQELQEKQYT